MLLVGCSVQRGELCQFNGIYCASESNKEFNYYTIIRIEENNVALERIYTTVGQITYYGEGVITKRTKWKNKIKFGTCFNREVEKQYYINDWEGHFYLKILSNSTFLLVDSNNGRISKTMFYPDQCACITHNVESFILGTRKIPIELLNY